MATISTHTQGSKMVYEHNTRDPELTKKEKHIDPNGEHENWRDEKLEDAFERLFGDAVRRYNAQQTRADRQIQDYLATIENEKNTHRKKHAKHAVYEMIPGVYFSEGEMRRNENGEMVAITQEDCKAILREYYAGWDKRNPNMVLIGAYFHADEQGDAPHCHFDIIPVGHNFQRGMDTQCSLSHALAEQGFVTAKGKGTAQIQWEAAENAELERICREHGIEIEHPQKGKDAEHVETEVYKATKKKDALERTIDHLQVKAALEAQNILDNAKPVDEKDPQSPIQMTKAEFDGLSRILQHQQQQRTPQQLTTELEVERKEIAETKRKAAAKEKAAEEREKAALEKEKQAEEATKAAQQMQEEAGRAKRAYESKIAKFKADAKQMFRSFVSKKIDNPLDKILASYKAVLFRHGLLEEAKTEIAKRTNQQMQQLDKMVDRAIDKMTDEPEQDEEREI